MNLREFCIASLLSVTFSFARDANQSFACFKQTAMNYSSDNVTSAGFGPGIEARFVYKKKLVLMADMSLLWGNGNAMSTLVGLGYQRPGFYSPGLFGIGGILSGQKTELLLQDGTRPSPAQWVTGLRVAPFCFSNSLGMASVIEFTYGFGPMQGKFMEITLLSVGARF